MGERHMPANRAVQFSVPAAILLCGGDKSSQARDIEKAHEIAKDWESSGKD